MTSNLGCVGLGVADALALGELLQALIPQSAPARQPDGSVLYDWRDPSGARLTVTADRHGAIADATPSYAGEPGALLDGLVALHDAVVTADVIEDGEAVTRMAVEVLAPGSVPSRGRASVTAFGLEVTVHEDEAAFASADASILAGGVEDEAAGGEKPTRLAAESFLPLGLFGAAAEAEPLARLAGTVLAVRTATVAATGQTFHAVRVRTVGMEVEVCLDATAHPEPPPNGGVVAGDVYLVADLDRPSVGRRWLRR